MVVRIGGRHLYLWRAVDSEGEVLDMLVQRRRNKPAALRLLRKLFKRQGFAPRTIVTDRLLSYGAALRELGFAGHHEQRQRANNRAENSHLPIRQARAEDAALQVSQIRSALPLRQCRHLQHVQLPTTSHLTTNFCANSAPRR